MFMHVPCWVLPRLHRAIRMKPQERDMERADGYLAVLKTVTAKLS